ncbi:MAG: UvrD-helicase domain-containing protein [Alphaproteobacteria bacterium]|nr:UvrD-helicase domain-containing protein [Alphaproteobacteria bacterium]
MPEKQFQHQVHQNIWMDASAGSGKTYQLVERFTALLFADIAADKILCLTYTNAAAAEMRQRIIKNLAEMTHLDDDVLRAKIATYHGCKQDAISNAQCNDARNLILKLLDAPEGLAIQTIHSYCQSILARFPLEAGIFPRTQIVADSQKQQIADEALDLLLDRGGQNAPLYTMLEQMMRYKDFNSLCDLLKNMLNIHYFYDGHYPQQTGDFNEKFKQFLGLKADDDLPKITKNYDALFASKRNQFEHAAQRLAGSGKADQKVAHHLKSYLKNKQLTELKTFFQTSTGTPRKDLCTKALKGDIGDFLDEMAVHYAAFDTAYKHFTIAEASHDLLNLFTYFQTAYQRLKNYYGVVEYDDLIVKMNALLNSEYAAWVLYKCDGGFSHILLDEAQDTNPLQWQIIKNIAERLFEKGALFVVGDKKQSIFSFQGADVDEFESNYQYFAAKSQAEHDAKTTTKLQTQKLQENRRSCAEIMDFVNLVFGKQSGELGLADDFPSHSAYRALPQDKGYVELWQLRHYQRGEKEVAMAEYARDIAHQMHILLASNTILPSTGKRIQPGDMMILVRKRDEMAHLIVKALRDKGVAVTGLDKYKLSEHIVYQDMMALLEFANLPQNDLNLAALLKTPFIDLSEQELFSLAHQRGDLSLYQSLHQQSETNQKFHKIATWLQQAVLNRADLLSPAEFLHEIYHKPLPLSPDISVMQAYHGRMASEALDNLQQLLDLAYQYQSEETPSFYGFTHWLYLNKAEIKRDFAQINQVKLQTIHAAKGLEAPIVFVPCLGKSRNKNSGDNIYGAGQLGKNDYPLWVPYSEMKTEIFTQIDENDKEKQRREEARLLYVALTRARDQLYLMGIEEEVKQSSSNNISWYQLIDEGLMASGVVANSQETRCWGTPLGAAIDGVMVDEGDARQKEITLLPQWADTPITATKDTKMPFHAPSQASKQTNEQDKPQQGANHVMQYAALRGSLIHKILERLSAMGGVLGHEAEATIMRYLANNGLTKQQAKEDAAQIMQLIASYPQFFNPQMAAMTHQKILNEVPIVGDVTDESGKVKSFYGIIDRLMIGGDKVLVLDYKTGKRTMRKLQNYQKVMQIYAQLLTPLYPRCHIETALLWVDELLFDRLDT